MLFISNTDWADQFKQDRFVDHLINTLDIIDKYPLFEIIWSDEIECCIWSDPQLPPWRRDKDRSNQLIPIIYKKLQTHRHFVSCPSTHTSFTVSPRMYCCNPKAFNCFLNLMHEVMRNYRDTLLVVGLNNVIPNIHDAYLFQCTICQLDLRPLLLNTPNDWFDHIVFDDEYWQDCAVNTNKIEDMLEVIRVRDCQNKPFLYKYSFLPQLLQDIASAVTNISPIIGQIAKRLTLTSQGARLDASLHDEYVHKTKDHRFRVTGSERIHYTYQNDGSILFLKYYSASRHDDGL